MSHTIAMQIVDNHNAAGDTPHFPENTNAFGVGQMMKEERTVHGVEGAVCERQLKRIARDGNCLHRHFQSSWIHVQRYHLATTTSDEGLADVASAASDIQQCFCICW